MSRIASRSKVRARMIVVIESVCGLSNSREQFFREEKKIQVLEGLQVLHQSAISGF